MKNLKEQFNKVKFLIIFIIGTALSVLITKVPDMGIFSGISLFILTIILSVDLWRIKCDKEYRERVVEFRRKEKQLPWQEKLGSAYLVLTLWCLQIIAPIMVIFILSHFCFIGFSTGVWSKAEINWAVFNLIIFIICRLALKAK